MFLAVFFILMIVYYYWGLLISYCHKYQPKLFNICIYEKFLTIGSDIVYQKLIYVSKIWKLG